MLQVTLARGHKPALPDNSRVVRVPSTPRARLPADSRAPVAPVDAPALARVLGLVHLGRAASVNAPDLAVRAWRLLRRAKRHAHSEPAMHVAAAAGSNTPRPKKAQ